MDERLLEIVSEFRISVDSSVNADLLKTLTRKYDLSYGEKLDWKRVRVLNIVGTVNWLGSWPHELAQGCYVDPTGQWVLLAGLKVNEVQAYLDRCPPELERLVIVDANMPALRLQPWKKLVELRLQNNDKLTEVAGMEKLPALKQLRIYFCDKFQRELDLSDHPGLEKLELSYSPIQGIQLNRKLKNLEDCGVSCTKIGNMDFLAYCPAVEFLNVSRISIRRLPEGIRQMKKLRRLYAEDLSLEELPDWLPELGLTMGRNFGFGIRLERTTVEGVDMSIFDQSQEMIRAWFASRKKAQESIPEEAENAGGPLRQIKVVFLGDGSTGKSLTVARLLNDGAIPPDFNGKATPGIAIEDKDYLLPDGRNVQVHFWDFGGQEILHSMHRIFLTDRTLYVVMINARNNTQDTQARYWLHNVRSFAPDCPVLVVLNQIDQNPNASVNERSLKKLYPNLRGIIRLSALEYSQDNFNREFTDKMLAEAAKFDSLDHFFPAEWMKTMERVRQMEGNYIRGAKFREICRECGVEGEKLRLDLLRWFHDIGVSFCYGSTQRLRDYVVLNPEWITNGIYTIIWNKHDKTANGMVNREEIYRLLNPGEGDDVQQVRSDMTYELGDVDFVLEVSRKFRLSFRLDEEREFIPMLCDANALPEADTFPEEPGVLEFRLEYDYLPMNVLHRLMVDMRQDLRMDKVWLTGALLQQKYNGVRAMVKSEGDVLSIYIQTTDRAHKAHTYLNTIRGVLDAIHQDMGLKVPITKVAYTENGETEYFSYKQVEGFRVNNQETIYSEVLDKMIPIEDILNGTDSRVEQQKKKLLRDMGDICVQLLENRKMVTELKANGKIGPVDENDRNDFLRNALRNMHYNAVDQTRVGLGGGRRQAGSLDIRLLHRDNLPWTTIEAMNLHSTSDSQKDYWDDHLNRLLNNYDPAGLPVLFLVSYVNCAADNYHKLFSAYTEHMREYSPPNCELRHKTLTEVFPLGQQHGYLRATRCTYDRSGTPVVVYHYFVGFIQGETD